MNKLIKRSFGLVLLIVWQNAHAQLERKPAIEDREVELTFHAPRHINLFTVEPLSKGELHWSIMHTFNTLDNGIQNLWGLDNGANIRFSLEYGISDRFSVGVGRSSSDKVYDANMRIHLLKQKQDNSMPISLSTAFIVGVNTANYEFLGDDSPNFTDRSSLAAQIMLARKFGSKFSVQVSPMMAYFFNMQTIYLSEGEDDLYFGIGLSAKYKIRPRTSITAQYLPIFNNNLAPNFGVGVDLEAGGHVFQMYVVTSPFLNEMYLLAGGNGMPGEQFRLGFNVNRIFALFNR